MNKNQIFNYISEFNILWNCLSGLFILTLYYLNNFGYSVEVNILNIIITGIFSSLIINNIMLFSNQKFKKLIGLLINILMFILYWYGIIYINTTTPSSSPLSSSVELLNTPSAQTTELLQPTTPANTVSQASSTTTSPFTDFINSPCFSKKMEICYHR